MSWDETLLAAQQLAEGELLLFDQVTTLLGDGATPVDCIKALKLVHGLGLAAGKDMVDAALSPDLTSRNEVLRESAIESIETCDDC